MVDHFSKWEFTSMSLTNLHPTHHECMKENAEWLFENSCEKLDNISLDLQLANLSISLQILATNMGLIDPKNFMENVNTIS